jgi:hypothetical protein
MATDLVRVAAWAMRLSRVVDRVVGLALLLAFYEWLGCLVSRSQTDEPEPAPLSPLDTRLPVFACAP